MKDCQMRVQTQDVAPRPIVSTAISFSASPIRVSIAEAAALLRMSRAQLYNRINDGAIKSHKDGARTYITRSELERYVDSCI
jgi:excisionase family DNA binding protein